MRQLRKLFRFEQEESPTLRAFSTFTKLMETELKLDPEFRSYSKTWMATLIENYTVCLRKAVEDNSPYRIRVAAVELANHALMIAANWGDLNDR